MEVGIQWWIGFNLFIVSMLLIDLGLFNRKPHEITIRESLLWSAGWIALALLFNLGVYYYLGSGAALTFFTGYIVEKALSVDNLFIFLLIFSYFRVPKQYQHKVLFLGILAAIVMRAIFIWFGVSLLASFHALNYVFGLFLIYSGIKFIVDKDKQFDIEKNSIIVFLKKHIHVTNSYHQGQFFIREHGKLFATPLLLVLVAIEVTDLFFALDSIPAILALTSDPFIAYTSNIFAILGLRSLYFSLAGLMELFFYLHHALATILIFIGCKMLTSQFIEVPIGFTLVFILAIFTVAIWGSIQHEKRKNSRNNHNNHKGP